MHNFLHENADKEPPDSVNKREDSESRIKPQKRRWSPPGVIRTGAEWGAWNRSKGGSGTLGLTEREFAFGFFYESCVLCALSLSSGRRRGRGGKAIKTRRGKLLWICATVLQTTEPYFRYVVDFDYYILQGNRRRFAFPTWHRPWGIDFFFF